MSCTNKSKNIKCGKCSFNILDNDFVRNKSLLEIAKVNANVSWMNEFNDNIDGASKIKSITISCFDELSIISASANEPMMKLSVLKYISIKLFKNWYAYYPLNRKLDSYKYIKAKLESMNMISSVTKMRTLTLSLVKYIELVTICKGSCTTIVPGKETTMCKFLLSDINKIVKFNSDGLVDLLNTILFTVKHIPDANLTIDLDTSYVTCSGNILMEQNFVKCKSTLASIKATYIYYLSAWCSANINKQSEIIKIKANIYNVRESDSISNIYDLSCQLFNII